MESEKKEIARIVELIREFQKRGYDNAATSMLRYSIGQTNFFKDDEFSKKWLLDNIPMFEYIEDCTKEYQILAENLYTGFCKKQILGAILEINQEISNGTLPEDEGFKKLREKLFNSETEAA